MKFKNVADWADYNRLTFILGYGDRSRIDIEEYIKECWCNPENLIKEMKKGRVKHKEPEKLYSWDEIKEFL